MPSDLDKPSVDHGHIYDSYVADKAIIYFDSNAWIDLATERTARAKDLLAACRDSVQEEQAIFPLSYPAVDELLYQPERYKPLRQAHLMDGLSHRVCFRHSNHVWAEEALATQVAFASGTPVGSCVARIFTCSVEYLNDAVFRFPDGWDDDSADEFIETFRSVIERVSLHWLWRTHPRDEAWMERREKTLESYVTKMHARINESSAMFRNGSGKLDRKRLLLEERIWAFNNHIRPTVVQDAINRLGPQGALQYFKSVTASRGEGSAERFEQLIESMPAVDVFTEVMANRVLNPTRKVKSTDYLDNEHCSVAPAYSDVFYTRDSNLYDLLVNRCRSIRRHGCKVLCDEADLIDILRGLE